MREAADRWLRGWTWARGRVLAALAATSAVLMVFHSAVPNTGAHLGSLVEAFLPWTGLAVPVLLAAALLRRSATALVALLLPVAAWTYLFGGTLLAGDGGAHDITVVQHNVSDVNTDPADTARALMEAGPELIALEELTPAALPLYEKTLAPVYPYHAVEGTVGLWSTYPLSDVTHLDIRPPGITDTGWNRGLRATARTPWGETAVYAVHLPSVRFRPTGFASGNRDDSAGLLGEALAAEKLERVIVLGDFNGTADDRGLAPVTSHMTAPPGDFAFSWPKTFPVARIDQVMARAATVTDIRTLRATGSDHLPIAAGIRFAS
ncbi:endonuclease/exonuclease/phosphatase family protein [Streptomyces sp. NBC_01465]|uniref:endonuclease/exonuclease/phosphatase family protein n=1 Tax=Streptomyces sp. NBC_01465 TaxID=2903878 RepID=UPI003FCE9199